MKDGGGMPALTVAIMRKRRDYHDEDEGEPKADKARRQMMVDAAKEVLGDRFTDDRMAALSAFVRMCQDAD